MVRCVCECVLHIKPFFLPVGIQHNQFPCRFLNPRRDTSSVVTKLRHSDTACTLLHFPHRQLFVHSPNTQLRIHLLLHAHRLTVRSYTSCAVAHTLPRHAVSHTLPAQSWSQTPCTQRIGHPPFPDGWSYRPIQRTQGFDDMSATWHQISCCADAIKFLNSDSCISYCTDLLRTPAPLCDHEPLESRVSVRSATTESNNNNSNNNNNNSGNNNDNNNG